MKKCVSLSLLTHFLFWLNIKCARTEANTDGRKWRLFCSGHALCKPTRRSEVVGSEWEDVVVLV